MVETGIEAAAKECCWCTCLTYCLVAVGAVVIASNLLSFVKFVYAHFIRSGKNLKKHGSWALVTGASDGIGRGYAENLAKKGLNIILVSRTESKLKELATEIETKYKVQTKVIAVDFSADDNSANFEKVKAAIQGMEIGVLVNNVGISYDYPEFFHLLDDKSIQNLININIIVTTQMTRMVLPGMIERKKGGAIVNLSSFSGVFPVPLLTVYSATKAYVDFFSLALSKEYTKDRIHVQSVTPAMVSTALSKTRANLTTPTWKAFTAQAVKFIGYENRANPNIVHSIMDWVIRCVLPLNFGLNYMYKMHYSIRVRALKKKERAAAEAKKQ